VLGWFVKVPENLAIYIIRAKAKQCPDKKNGNKLLKAFFGFINLL
jgi:hypothetical protein